MSALKPPATEYEHRPCAVCGALTDADAETMCKQSSDQSGEYWCNGGAEEVSYPDGRLRFETAASLAALDAYYDALTDEQDAATPHSGEKQ